MEKIWDYIVNKMPGELMVSLIVMLIIAIVAIVFGCKIKKADPTKPTKGVAMLAEWLVEFSTNTIDEYLGDAYEFAVPYFFFLITYIPLAF